MYPNLVYTIQDLVYTIHYKFDIFAHKTSIYCIACPRLIYFKISKMNNLFFQWRPNYYRAFETIVLCFTVCAVVPATIVTFVHDSISCFRKKSPSDKLFSGKIRKWKLKQVITPNNYFQEFRKFHTFFSVGDTKVSGVIRHCSSNL